MSLGAQTPEIPDIDAISDGFQIIDASYFEVEQEDSGLQIHPNCLCPMCGSYQNKFLCSRCIKGGSFTYSRQPSGRRAMEIRKSISQCRLGLSQLSQRRANLTSHLQTLASKQECMDKELLGYSKKVEYWRHRYLLELLGTYFPVTLATDSHQPDQLVGASLHVDKENVFIGPEPMLSSSAALTYCVPVINAATVFLDVWLPSIVRQNLHLSGPFLAVLPQRDNLGRVYSAVLHAVHMLCSSRNCDVRGILQRSLPQSQVSWRLQAAQSDQNPLLGLHCLNLLAQSVSTDSSVRARLFDEPYTLKLNGIFGTVGMPANNPYYRLAVNQLRLKTTVEQGKEMKESDEFSQEEEGESEELSRDCKNIVQRPN